MQKCVEFIVVISSVVSIIGPGAVYADESLAAGQSMNPEKASAMESMYTQGSPTEAHKALADFVGTWNHTAQWWMSPDEAPISMTGTTKSSLILDSRFLMQQVSGEIEAEGQPTFEGIGITGYDNVRSEYQSVWFDNMSTGIMIGTGEFDDETKTLSEEGEFSCALTMETHRKFRAEWKIIDENNITYESYMQTPDGHEFKAMEIRYTRKL